MPHSEKHAQRLLRELKPKLPKQAGVVLERSCYLDPGFCNLFLDHCEETTFNDHQAGLELARAGVRLAQIVPEDLSDPEDMRQHRERIVRGYGLLGSAYRAVTRYEDAEVAYRAAYRLCRRQVSDSCRAGLAMRVAYLRVCQGRSADALRLIQQARKLFGKAADETGSGTAAALHGAILIEIGDFKEAIDVLSEALAYQRLDSRSELSATHNLADAVSRADDPALLPLAIEHLLKARRLLGPRRSVQKCRLYWVEGRILIRLGKVDAGEQRYRKALAGFIHFSVPSSLALVSLDLSALLRFAGRWPELEKLAADTYRRFRDLGEDEQSLVALKLWLDAVEGRTLTEELINEVKETVQVRMTRPSVTRTDR